MTLLAATCELWVDGIRYPDGSTGEDPSNPFAVSGLSITWGRQNTIDQPSPAQCTFTVMDPPGGALRFDETVRLGSVAVVWSVIPGGSRVLVFGGRVTDLTASFDDGAGSGTCDVACADIMADLANRFVGAEPWALEQLWQRARRILTAAGIPDEGPANLNVPTRPALYNVSRMDVDRQAGSTLLYDLATTGGAVLWAAARPDGGLYFYFEDPWARASLVRFVKNPDTGLWAPSSASGGSGFPVDACLVLQDPVKWERAVTDLLTRVTVRWLDQSTSPDPTERSVQTLDTDAEITYGARGVSVGTILTTPADASTIAGGIMAAHPTAPQWRAGGLTWDLALTENLDAATAVLAVHLLDNVLRLGLPLKLDNLPYWTPTTAAVSLYVEGGTYKFEDGRWLLALDCSPATGLGKSITFDQVDETVRYVDVDRAVRYLDMVGVGP